MFTLILFLIVLQGNCENLWVILVSLLSGTVICALKISEYDSQF